MNLKRIENEGKKEIEREREIAKMVLLRIKERDDQKGNRLKKRNKKEKKNHSKQSGKCWYHGKNESEMV